MADKKQFKIGAAASYIQVDEMARLMGTTTPQASALCAHLKIPLLKFAGQESHYVLVYALETALFQLGLPKEIRQDVALARTHQELASLTYGTLTKEALRERVSLMVKTLTLSSKRTKIRRPNASWKSNTGRTLAP